MTNQRETTLVWERATGKPIHNAIVWQDRRTATVCADLRDKGAGPAVAAKTGLLLDPYFSATKIARILDDVPGLGEARKRALLRQFTSLKRLRAASIEELESVPGIGPTLARAVHEALLAGAVTATPAVNVTTGEILD